MKNLLLLNEEIIIKKRIFEQRISDDYLKLDY